MDSFDEKEDVNNYYLETSFKKDFYKEKEEDNKPEIISIPKVTREPNTNYNELGEEIRNYDGFFLAKTPTHVSEEISVKRSQIPSIFKNDSKKNFSGNALGNFNILNIKYLGNDTLVQEQNSPDVYFTDGFVTIYSIKLINKFVEKNGRKESNVDSLSLSYQKSIFIFGLFIEQIEEIDGFGFVKDETEKVLLEYLKLDIMNDQDFLNNKKYFQNLKGVGDNLQVLMKYLQNYFRFFNKIKETIIPCLKNINLLSFFSHIILKKLDKKIIINNEHEVISIIERLEFVDILENIKDYSELIEEKIYNSLLNENLNDLDFTMNHRLDNLKIYSIFKDLVNLKKFYLDPILLLYNKKVYKRLHEKVEGKNNFHFFCYKQLLMKMRTFFVENFTFCCCDKYFFESLPNKKIFNICIKCSILLCMKCLKFHQSHIQDVCNLSIFEVDELTKKLILSLPSESKRFLEKARSSSKSRKYLILLDFIKFVILEYLVKEAIKNSADLGSFKRMLIENKLFIKDILERVNKDNEKIPYPNYGNSEPCDNFDLGNYYYQLKKSNKCKKLKTTDFNISVNRYLVEEIYYNIKSNEMNKHAEIIKSDEANQIIEDKMKDINVLISSKNSPKQLYREIFISKCEKNNFIENYLFPFHPRNFLNVDHLITDSNNLNKSIISGNVKNLVKSKSVLINKIENVSKATESKKNNKKLEFNKKMTFSFKKVNLNEDSEKLLQLDYDHYKMESNRNRPKKSLSLVNSVTKTQSNDELKILEEIIEESKHHDLKNKIKIILIFFEILVDKVENYGFYLNEEMLKIELNKNKE
jgi:hypothetical protein